MRLILVACLLWAFQSRAQDSTSAHKWAVTFKPLGAVNPYLNNYTFGARYQLSKKFIAEANVGLIKTWYFINSTTEDASSTGFRLGAEMKYVMVGGLYFAIQGFYNDYVKETEEYVMRFAETYQEKMKIERFITSWTGHLNTGYILTTRNKKFFFDFFGGIGVRQKTVRIPDVPDDVTFPEEGDGGFDPLNESPGSYVYPSLTMGVAVGYILAP